MEEIKQIDMPTVPAFKAHRYVVTLTSGKTFTVFVHRGSVPAERVKSMVSPHEVIRSCVKEFVF